MYRQGSLVSITLQQILDRGIDVLDFDFPLHSQIPKSEFKQRFEDYFLFHEIGFETVARFKHFLKVELNLIMPIYNKYFETELLEVRILDNYSLNEEYTHTRSVETNNEFEGTSGSNVTANSSGKNTGGDRVLYKDTPKTKVDIANVDIVNNITKTIIDNGFTNTDTSNATNTSNTTGNEVVNETDTYTKLMTGNIGVQTDSDAIANYRNNLLNIWQKLFGELELLFLGTINMEEDNDLW